MVSAGIAPVGNANPLLPTWNGRLRAELAQRRVSTDDGEHVALDAVVLLARA